MESRVGARRYRARRVGYPNAAAETMEVSPHAIRPALVAAFERTVALKPGSDAVLAGLSPAKARATATAAWCPSWSCPAAT